MGRTGRRWGLALVSIVVAVASSGCWWGQSRFSAGWTSYNPHERALTSANVAGITELWSTPAPVEGWPLVSWRNRVFAVHGNAVHAYDAGTGTEVWQTPSAFSGFVWVRDGVLYVIDSAEGVLQARDASTGARLPGEDVRAWGDPVGDLPDGLVAVGARYGLMRGVVDPGERDRYPTLRLYDWETGTSALVPVGGDQYRPGPLDEAGRRYYLIGPPRGGGVQGVVTAVSFTGDELWAHEVSLSFPTAPVLDAGRLYVGNRYTFGHDGFDVLDAETGDELWHGTVPGEMAQPAVREGVVYTGLEMVEDGRLLAYEDCGAPACDPIWAGSGGGRVASVVAAGDLVYATSWDDAAQSSTIRIYAADGCGAPTCPPLRTIEDGGPAIVSGGRLFVAGADGLRAYGLAG